MQIYNSNSARHRIGPLLHRRRECCASKSVSALAAFLMLSGTVLPLQAIAATSIKQAISDAVKRNPLLDEQRAKQQASERRGDQVFGRFLPSLSLSAEVGPEWFDRPESFAPQDNRKWRRRKTFGISLNQLLFDAGLTRHELYRERARADADQFEIYNRSERIALSTAEAFLEVRRIREMVTIINGRIAEHTTLRNKLEKTTKDGLTTRGDVLFVENQIATARTDRSRLKVTKADIEARLHRLTGRKHARLLRPALLKRPAIKLRGAVVLGLRKHPQLASLALEREALSEDITVSERRRFPVVRLEANARKGFDVNGIDGRNDEVRALVTFNWNFYAGGSKIAEQEEKVELFVAADARLRDSSDTVREAIEKNWQAQRALSRQVASLGVQLATAREVHEVFEKEFDVGHRSISDLSEALDRVYRIKEQLASARIVHIFSSYQLRAATGTLLSFLGIPPGHRLGAVDQSSIANIIEFGGNLAKTTVK